MGRSASSVSYAYEENFGPDEFKLGTVPSSSQQSEAPSRDKKREINQITIISNSTL